MDKEILAENKAENIEKTTEDFRSKVNQTRKLFDADAYQREFTAKVRSCKACKSGFEIVLDQTCFFPEEGGQSADQGMLFIVDTETNSGKTDQESTEVSAKPQSAIKVLDVKISKDNIITHICDKEIEVGSNVWGEIDWRKRFSDMQQHSGEHIMSGLVYASFGYHNVGFHLSQKEVTMDFDGVLTEEDVAELERKANQAIYENFTVEVNYPSKEELDAMDYRSKKELEGPIRIVTFPGYDVCACCAPHVHRTGEIGIIKIVHLMNYKGGVRLNLLCGSRALADFQEKQNSVTSISNALSAKSAEVYGAVSKLQEDLLKLKNQMAELERKHILSIAENVPSSDKNICLFEDSLGNIAQRELVNLLTKKCSGFCGVFVGTDQGGYRYIISGGDARVMNQKLKETCNARGGGSAEMVQGSLTGKRSVIEELFS